MKLLIILLIGFLVFLYVYTFVKIKKRRKSNIDIVSEYNQRYLNKENKINTTSEASNYKKYITKYNSTVDYVNKDELL